MLGGKIGCRESRPFICNVSNITLSGEGHCASRSGTPSTCGSLGSLGSLISLTSGEFFFGVGWGCEAWNGCKGSINGTAQWRARNYLILKVRTNSNIWALRVIISAGNESIGES